MISVVIVAHDSGEILRRSIASVGSPPPQETEVIVVDNASKDGCCSGLDEEFPWVTLISLETNIGYGAACNRAAEKASGEKLVLLNSDAWLESDALELMVEAADREGNIACVIPRLLYPDGKRQFEWAPSPGLLGEAVQLVRNRYESAGWNHDPFERVWQRLFEPGWYTGACMLLNQSAFDRVGGFDEEMVMYYEDADLCARLQQDGWRHCRVRAAVVRHVRGGSAPPVWLELERRKSQLRYYRKHRPAWERRVLTAYLRRRYRTGAIADWLNSRRQKERDRKESDA